MSNPLLNLTTSVLSEALAKETSVIVAYHPTIFKGLQSLTLANPLQRSLLQCAAEGVSVYSPHTALDSVWGGINDWLARGMLGSSLSSSSSPEEGIVEPLVGLKLGANGESEGAEGRLVTLNQPIEIDELVRRIKSHLKLANVQVGYPDVAEGSPSKLVQTIAICAGSGGSMLVGKPADVYFTGEMSHHEVLASVAAGKHVILCGHTNTERGYLPILAEKLRNGLSEDQEFGEAVEVLVSRGYTLRYSNIRIHNHAMSTRCRQSNQTTDRCRLA
ncbi:NGG1 interacting factor 3 [Coprinopsis cinerea okayama7|uniref:NGG1 interacting factor 3 n=1 Tax=Coprinopsis cinerea (strain Okayama-7 / 130 / ATCC MYA-4618 / FGSC 9003) TaxID=240176 RepID=A8N3H0_COPC7|nr:NGG1 interacting factor 3 [Coprinopsis cinerea okayama7\|eukprot:XP_001829547.2 NGG1 interacting factor 3 [Coprinopsis cinerea okayama7\